MGLFARATFDAVDFNSFLTFLIAYNAWSPSVILWVFINYLYLPRVDSGAHKMDASSV